LLPSYIANRENIFTYGVVWQCMATTLEQGGTGVLQQLHGERVPAELQPLLDHYDEVTTDRSRLLWKWLWHVFPEFRLSSVPDRHTAAARRAKFGLSVFMTVLDDLSERHRDRETFEAGRKIPFAGASAPTAGVDDGAYELLRHAWEATESYLDDAPRRDRFGELFDFDLRQSLNSMDFNRLVNESPALASRTGAELYDTHNMLLYLYVDIDLAFSPGFDTADLPTLRDVTWEAQRLVRIGNWVTTWERELAEGDFTSRVVVEAMEQGVVTRAELQAGSVPVDRLVERIRGTDIEHDLLRTWNDIYGDLTATDHGVDSVDLDGFIDGIRYILEVDVKARGYK
jgi:hypothetical protein